VLGIRKFDWVDASQYRSMGISYIQHNGGYEIMRFMQDDVPFWYVAKCFFKLGVSTLVSVLHESFGV
jgi:hypothetical protein